MNSKAIRKQLLAAVAMVLVAAVALGSSTYAWFVASGTVTATGMKVQAKSEGGLAIRWAGETSELWGTSASAKMNTAKELLPASTADLAKWTYAKAKSASASAADTTTYAPVTSDVFNGSGAFIDDNNYVVMQPFEIRSTAEDRPAKGLYVSGVTVTRGENKDLDPAIRVGVRLVNSDKSVVGNFIYAPIAGHSTNYTWKDASTSANTATAVTLASVGDGSNNQSQLVASGTTIPFDKGQAVKVQIFIWYEGEDATLFSNNYAANALDVTVEFSSNSFASAAGGGTTTPTGPVDLSSGAIVSGVATPAKASSEADSNTNYYAIEGKTTPDGAQLYTDVDSRNGLTSTSKIYTISGGVASLYNNVTRPS